MYRLVTVVHVGFVFLTDAGFLFSTSTIVIVVLLAVIFHHLYSISLHPFDIHLLLAGIVYLFYVPFLFILIPLYAVCNIVDQTWGTRDNVNQNVSVTRFLRFPKFRKRKSSNLKYRSNAFQNSAIDLKDVNEDEALFWQNLVTDCIGVSVNSGISQEDLTNGLRSLRKRAVIGYLTVNFLWIVILIGTDELLTKFLTYRLLFGLIVLSILCVPTFIQMLGMTVYRCSDMLTRFGRFIS